MADNFNISDTPETPGPKSVEVPGDIADGTTGEVLSWKDTGEAVVVAAGTSGHALTSVGGFLAPTFAETAQLFGAQTFNGEKTFQDLIIDDAIVELVASLLTLQRNSAGSTDLRILSNGDNDATIRLERGNDANRFFRMDMATNFLRVDQGSNITSALFNINLRNCDYIWRGTTDANLFRCDASQDAIGCGASPVVTAKMEIASTTKGLLIPRMTTTERDAIVSPATGLLIYNITTLTLQDYNGTVWADV